MQGDVARTGGSSPGLDHFPGFPGRQRMRDGGSSEPETPPSSEHLALSPFQGAGFASVMAVLGLLALAVVLVTGAYRQVVREYWTKALAQGPAKPTTGRSSFVRATALSFPKVRPCARS